MARIFVYGTLKTGQPNHYRLLDGANGQARLVCAARTVQRYPLVIGGRHNVPFLLDVPGRGHRVRGELYSVDQRMLAFLDHFEGVPTWYQRVPLELEAAPEEGGPEGGGDGAAPQAFAYVRKDFEAELLQLRSFESYDSLGDHGLQYVTREARD